MQDRHTHLPAPNTDELLQLAEIAWLYYGEERTQEQIAQETGLSRPTISRMLKDARDHGIVEIRVHYQFQTVPRLEAELCAAFGLDEAKVLATGDSGSEIGHLREVPQRVGALAARYLQKQIPDHSTIGLGWGSMVYNVVSSGHLARKRGMTVVQVQGSIGGATQEIDGARITASLGRALGARVYLLSAPMVVADPAVRIGLMRDEHIRQTLEIGRKAETLVVGVGAVTVQSGLYRAGYLNDADLDYIRAEGAVGDICGSYFDLEGSLCRLELNDRTIALDAEAMRRVPRRVGVSCGVAKALPNVGAARSGLINVLITDEHAAEEMLALARAEPHALRGVG
jgi:DNA-binding transcriptional regulator LsrR (DeoR family)